MRNRGDAYVLNYYKSNAHNFVEVEYLDKKG